MQNKKLITGLRAINEALIEAAKKDTDILFFGEGIADPNDYLTTIPIRD